MSLNLIIQAAKELLNHPDAEETKAYIDSRLSKTQQENFEFGYIPNTNNIDLLLDKVGKQILLDNKIIYEKHSDSETQIVSAFENLNLVMPYKDVYNETIAIVARTILNEKTRKELKLEKYKNSVFNKGYHLFGLNYNKYNILEHDCVYVVEGQFDMIKAYEKGINNVVALGNSNMTRDQFCLITRYTENIFLLLDNDEAGKKGADKAQRKFGQLANIIQARLPDGYKDLDEYLKDYDELNVVI